MSADYAPAASMASVQNSYDCEEVITSMHQINRMVKKSKSRMASKRPS